MKNEFKEIPQRLWEDYVQYRDRMSVLKEMELGSKEYNSTMKEWDELNNKINEIEFDLGYDYEQLCRRYDESLKKD